MSKTKKTEIYDFAKQYAASGTVRLHMPGHKGVPLHGLEPLDLTEIQGADYLFESEGIIRRSEERMAELYGAAMTCYSTEGSSLSIKAMLAIAKRCAGGGRIKIAAGRNCHRAFLNALILLDIEPVWIWPKTPSTGICSSSLTPEDVAAALDNDKDIAAVYITSPDYTGRLADVAGISRVCKARGVLLLVDNAHGAYLRFTEPCLHPLSLGADICTDSAHKTLPCYTGASMLHISGQAPEGFAACAKAEMSLFASTSPSYLIMQSLDLCAGELSEGLPEKIRACCERVAVLRRELSELGWTLTGDEPMKLCIEPREQGYTGNELADLLRESGIECEYSDPDCVVLMPSPCNSEEDLERLTEALGAIPKGSPLPTDAVPTLTVPRRALLPREAYFSPQRLIPAKDAEGLICGRSALSCQPSVPVVVSGEVFDKNVLAVLEYYGMEKVWVVEG
ncbi:MAG: PLP-dependent transferase [Ruminococcus sp.]|nr:PLP-dependent transferase [Ruminococcus sp.]